MWAGFLVDLTNQMPNTSFCRASTITSPIRQVKDAEEIAVVREAGAAVDRIATRLQRGEIPLVGQTEAAVSAELGRQILEEGHDRVNFAIVAAGRTPPVRIITPVSASSRLANRCSAISAAR